MRTCLVTYLPDPEAHPAREMRVLYRRRWRIESHFRDLKAALGAGTLRSVTPAVVRRELAARLRAADLVRMIIPEAGELSGVDPTGSVSRSPPGSSRPSPSRWDASPPGGCRSCTRRCCRRSPPIWWSADQAETSPAGCAAIPAAVLSWPLLATAGEIPMRLKEAPFGPTPLAAIPLTPTLSQKEREALPHRGVQGQVENQTPLCVLCVLSVWKGFCTGNGA